MTSKQSGKNHPHPKCSGNQFNKTWQPYTSCRASKTTFFVCGHALFYWKNVVSTCPAIRITSFCSCYRYHWFITVPATKTSQVSPCFLIAHCTVHSARCSDISMTLCRFSEAKNIMFCLFTNPPMWKWVSSLNHK